MRFCHVTTFYPPWNFGGDGILVQQICEGLARRGHQVDVVHCLDAYQLKGGPARQAAADPPNIRRYGLRSGWGPLSPLITQQTGRPGPKRRALREILDADYDVVHFHNVSLVGGPGVLTMSRAPVTLYTMHDHWLVCPTHVLWKFRNRPCDGPQCIRCSLLNGIPPQWWRYTSHLARSLEHVDAILAPSRFTADTLREAGIDRPYRVLSSFSVLATADAAVDYRSDKPLFVYAGRLESSKGLEQLLAAFRERTSYELLVAGNGSLDRSLREEYADCAHIRFLGAVPHGRMAALFRDATAVVSPTWGPESFHLVTIEAMSCGTPVIGRRAGGSVEAIELTGGGLVYDRPEELLPLVDRLAQDPDLRQQLSARASEGYRRHYSEERWMERYFALIAELAGPRASGGTEAPQLY
jgi:glycosyltransferase involved in cell wall biosynthesis